MDIHSQIVNAYRKLLNEKSYSDIPIALICEEAAVSRKTFYNYFSNKNEVVTAIIYEDLIRLSEFIDETVDREEYKSLPKFTLEASYQRVLSSKKAYETLQEKMGREALFELIYQVVLNYSLKTARNFDISQEEQEYAGRLLALANAGLITNWIEGGMIIPPDRMARYHRTWLLSPWQELEDKRVNKEKAQG